VLLDELIPIHDFARVAAAGVVGYENVQIDHGRIKGGGVQGRRDLAQALAQTRANNLVSKLQTFRDVRQRPTFDMAQTYRLEGLKFEPSHRLRQYGVAALGFDGASYTGAWTIGWAGSRTGPGVAAQGNMLVGPEVVEASFRAFQASAGCWLGDRLLRALEAGAVPGGDRRCEPGQAALSAFVMLARPGDRPEAPFLWLTAPEQRKGGRNPVALLRRTYEAWRGGHSGLPPRLAECGVDGALHEGATQPRGQGQ